MMKRFVTPLLAISGLALPVLAAGAATGPASPRMSAGSAAAPAPTAGTPYVLAANDQIAIAVREHADLSMVETIRPDGKISYPVVGVLQAKGKTVEQLRREITARLRAYIVNPDVSITVVGYHSDVIYVLGDVRTYGPEPYSPGISAREALNLAGGANSTADLKHVQVQRSHKTIATVDLSNPSARPFVLQEGDVLVVPLLPRETVSVAGVVTRPGTQPLLPGERILDAVTTAGIINEPVAQPAAVSSPGALGAPLIAAPDLRNATLTRGGVTRVIDIEAMLKGQTADNIPLEPDDIIYVPAAAPTIPARITVVGDVLHPGALPFIPGERMLDALVAAGVSPSSTAAPGPESSGSIGGGALASTGSAETAVPPPDLTKVILTRSGEAQTIDMSAVFRGDMTGNLPLEAGDILYVPAQGGHIVTILGEVSRPQTVRFGPGAHVLDLLNLSGGPTAQAGLSQATLQRLGGEKIPIDLNALLQGKDASQNLALQDGDVLTVPMNTRMIAVFGAVAKPGVYGFRPGDDVVEAVLIAGGASTNASLNDIGLVRHNPRGENTRYKINMDQIVREGNTATDQKLQAGDVVYVPARGQGGNTNNILAIVSGLSAIRLLFPHL